MTRAERLAAQISAEVDARVAALAAEIAPAIAEGIRIQANRPASERGAVTLQFGRVDGVLDDYVSVTLDGATAPISASMLGTLTQDQRVAVLLVPPSGALAIGDGGGGGVTGIIRTEYLRCTLDMPGNGAVDGQGGWFVDEGLQWAHLSGDVLVDDTNPFHLRFLQTGVYALSILAASDISILVPSPFASLFSSFNVAGVLPAPIGNWVLSGSGFDLTAALGTGITAAPFGMSGAVIAPFTEDDLMTFVASLLSVFETATTGTVEFTFVIVEYTGTTGNGGGVSPANYPPFFTNTTPPDAVNGNPYSYTFTVNASPAATWSVSPAFGGVLPSGLALNSSTGQLSGTPSDTPGFFQFMIEADNGETPPAQFMFVIELT